MNKINGSHILSGAIGYVSLRAAKSRDANEIMNCYRAIGLLRSIYLDVLVADKMAQFSGEASQ